MKQIAVRVLRGTLAALLGASAPTGVVQSQELLGTLVAEDGRTPVADVLVQVSNAVTGVVVARVRTASDGTFRVRVGLDSMHLKALRIGTRPVLLASFRLRAGEVRSERFAWRSLPVQLPARNAVASTRCEAPTARNSRIAADLFEQVMAAIAATSTPDSSFVVALRVRRVALTADERQTLSDRQRDSSATWPVRPLTRSVDELFDRGFFANGRSGDEIYFAPSPEFFTSPRFLDEYCLYYSGESMNNPDLVGVSFHSARHNASSVRIRGSFWILRSTGRLERLSFAYEGLPVEEASGRPEGWIRFSSLKNGLTIPLAWQIRMPQVVGSAVLSRPNPRGEVTRTLQRRLTGIILLSGEVVHVTRGLDELLAP